MEKAIISYSPNESQDITEECFGMFYTSFLKKLIFLIILYGL